MSFTTTYDANGNMLSQTIATNTITVYVGRKIGRENYGNQEASLHMQIDVTEDDTMESIEEKIKQTYAFANTIILNQLGLASTVKDGVVRDLPPAADDMPAKKMPAKAAAPRVATRKVAAAGEKDALWQDWLDNPNDWYDNRPSVTGTPKRNPRGPDLKHKTNGQALWIDSAPEFVKLTLNGDAAVA